MAREFLQITEESAYKTPVGSPVLGTSQFVMRLDGGNAFAGRPVPMTAEVPYGGGLAVPAYTVSDQLGVKATLKTKLCYSQASFLLGLALTRVNAGQTSPWTTTEPAGDLASVTIDHGITRSDGTIKRRRYLGMKAESLKLTVSRQSKIADLEIGFVGSTPQGNQFDSSTDPTSVMFPVPADTAYPTDVVKFIDTAGALTIGSVRTQYDALTIDVRNTLDPRWFESRFVQVLRCLGRKATLGANLYYKPTPDDRATFEGLTVQTVELIPTNGTHTITLNFNGQNVPDGLDDDLAIDKVYMQNYRLKNQWDAAAGSDITFSYL